MLQTLFTGRNLITTNSLASTNNYASELLANNEPIEGSAIMAAYQEQGRGQRGSNWVSEKGSNLLVSYVFYPKFLNVQDQFFLNIFVSLAATKTLSSLGVGQVKIKWPNDIYVANNKIGGILIENSIKGNQISNSIIGLGININQREFPDFPVKATSLSLLKEKSFDVTNVFEILSNFLETYYLSLKGGNLILLKEEYLNTLFRRNEFFSYENNGEKFEAKIVSVSNEGKLIMETQSGRRKEFANKEVRFI